MKRLQQRTDEILSAEEQAGFRVERGTRPDLHAKTNNGQICEIFQGFPCLLD